MWVDKWVGEWGRKGIERVRCCLFTVRGQARGLHRHHLGAMAAARVDLRLSRLCLQTLGHRSLQLRQHLVDRQTRGVNGFADTAAAATVLVIVVVFDGGAPGHCGSGGLQAVVRGRGIHLATGGSVGTVQGDVPLGHHLQTAAAVATTIAAAAGAL